MNDLHLHELSSKNSHSMPNVSKKADHVEKTYSEGLAKKILASIGGLSLAAGGITLGATSGGFAIPIGGALASAGIASAYQGIEKAYRNKPLDASEYVSDVGLGAVIGVLTGGLGVAGEMVALNVAHNTLKIGVSKEGIQTATRALVGASAKSFNEFKKCLLRKKKWSDFGVERNYDGTVSRKATLLSWFSDIAVSTLGGSTIHISSKFSKVFDENLTRIAFEAEKVLVDKAIEYVKNEDEHEETETDTEIKEDESKLSDYDLVSEFEDYEIISLDDEALLEIKKA